MFRKFLDIGRKAIDYFYEDLPQPARTRPPQRDLPPGMVNLEERLNENFGQEAVNVAGKLYFLNLDDIRQRYGERWPNLSKLIHACMKRTIERHISPGDYFAPWGDAYIIMFAGLDEDAARRKCRVIGLEVEQHLFGEDAALDNIGISSVVAEIDGRLHIRDMAAIEEIDQLLDNAPQPGQRARPEGPTDAKEILSLLRFVFRPVWNARRKFITCYTCLPVIDLSGGGMLEGEDVVPDHAPSYLVTEIDCRAVTTALETLDTLAGRDQRVHLAVPIHYSTLVGQVSRKRLAATLRKMEKLHRRFLIFELLGLPPDLPEAELIALAFIVRPFARGICARLPDGYAGSIEWSRQSVFAVGQAMPEHVVTEAELPSRLADFLARAGRRRMRTYVCGLDRREFVRAARKAGIDHLGGAAAGALFQRPGGDDLPGLEALGTALMDRRKPDASPAVADTEEPAPPRTHAVPAPAPQMADVPGSGN